MKVRKVNKIINNPELIKEWDMERNMKLGLSPELISIGSHKTAYWICSICGKHYSYMVRDKFRAKIGCPDCARKARSVSNRKTKIQGKKHLSVTHPELVEEWLESVDEPLSPSEVTANSNKRIKWKCKKCGGIYVAYISNRTAKGSACPYCAGQKVLTGVNDLLSVNPQLASEWSDKNDCSPSDFLPHSHRKVFWKCAAGHTDYLATIKSRSYGQGCPICARESQTSFPEQAVFFFIKKVFPDAENRYKYEDKIEIDIYIPSTKTGIEYNGYYAHKNRKEQDMRKRATLEMKGVKLYVIQEYRSKDERGRADFYISANYDFDELGNLIDGVLNILGANKIHVNVSEHAIEIREQYLSIRKQNSIATKMPFLLEEWDYSRNGNINPDFVSIGSHQKYYWKCKKCGKSYCSVVKSRAQGTGCPYCSGKTLARGTNDLEIRYPAIALSWDYEKNGISPSDVYGGGQTKYFWKCEKGHSYLCSISNRIKGRGCPYCAGKKVLLGYNDFLTVRPQDVLDWDYSLNDCLPSEVHYNSQSKIIHWVCHKCGYKWQSTISAKCQCKNCKDKIL